MIVMVIGCANLTTILLENYKQFETHTVFLPVPIVWSLVGPVLELGVDFLFRIQSKSSVESCIQEQNVSTSLSKRHSSGPKKTGYALVNSRHFSISNLGYGTTVFALCYLSPHPPPLSNNTHRFKIW